MGLELNIDVLLNSINKLSDAEKVAFNEIIFKEYLQTGNLTDYHNIVTGVKCNDPIPFGDKEQSWDFMQNAAGRNSACDPILTTLGAKLSKKTWDTGIYTNAIEFCYKDIDCKFKDYLGSDKCSNADPEGTLYLDFLLDLVGEALQNSHWTKTYFGAKTSSNTALNANDGFFVQYLAISALNTDQRISIDANQGNTYEQQKLTDPDIGFNTFNSIYERVEDMYSLREKSGLYIKSTRSLATNYLRWLRKNKQVDCCERDPLSNIYQLEKLNIYGLPIKVVDEWDQIIHATDDEGNPVFDELNNGTRYTNPHRAVCTYKENEPIGTCDSEQLSKIDLQYNPYDKKTKVEAEYDVDAKVLRDTDFIIAI